MGIVAFTREIQYFVYRLGQYELFNWNQCDLVDFWGFGDRDLYVLLYIYLEVRGDDKQRLVADIAGNMH